MPLELLIEHWLALLCLAIGLSHFLYPGKWAALFRPLLARESSGLILAAINLPLGLAIALGHNVWVWGIPLIVTLVGWMIVAKGLVYLLFPSAPQRMMKSDQQLRSGMTFAGVAMILIGALLAYDSILS